MNDQAEQLRKIVSNTRTTPDSKVHQMKILTIASGKGGVGKSNFVVNLALGLKAQGKNPLILDADFGLANVEIILGERPKYHLAHFISGECSLQQLITVSKYNIPFISGGSGIHQMMFLAPEKIDEIGNALKALEGITDMLLIDTGAGINDIVMKFCRLAHEIYLVVTPEPTSVTDAYALIKTLISVAPSGLKFKIVISKAFSKEEAHQVFHKLAYVCKSFLTQEIEYAGYVPYDEKMLYAVKNQVPITLYEKKTKASLAYLEMSRAIIKGVIPQETEKTSWVHRFKKLFTN